MSEYDHLKTMKDRMEEHNKAVEIADLEGQLKHAAGEVNDLLDKNASLRALLAEARSALRKIKSGVKNASPNASYGGTKFVALRRKEMMDEAAAVLAKLEALK